MSRPTTNTVEYFPHVAKRGKIVAIIENKFGNDGYAAMYKTFEVLAESENHTLDCREPSDLEYFYSVLRVESERGAAIMGELARLHVIDADLWAVGILWSDILANELAPVYEKRRRLRPEKPVIGTGNPVPITQTPINMVITPQSRVEESKEENSTAPRVSVTEKDFDDIWNLYPNRMGKKESLRHFRATVKTTEDLEAIRAALGNYKRSEKVTKGFIQGGSRWFNDWQSWVSPAPMMMQGARASPDQGPPRPESTYRCEYCKRDVPVSQRAIHWSEGRCPAYKPADPAVVKEAFKAIKNLARSLSVEPVKGERSNLETMRDLSLARDNQRETKR